MLRLDGAIGTQIQRCTLAEDDFRQGFFVDWDGISAVFTDRWRKVRELVSSAEAAQGRGATDEARTYCHWAEVYLASLPAGEEQLRERAWIHFPWLSRKSCLFNTGRGFIPPTRGSGTWKMEYSVHQRHGAYSIVRTSVIMDPWTLGPCDGFVVPGCPRRRRAAAVFRPSDRVHRSLFDSLPASQRPARPRVELLKFLSPPGPCLNR